MRRRNKILSAAIFMFSAQFVAADTTPMKIGDINKGVPRHSYLMVQGTIFKSLTLTMFVLDDGTGKIVLDMDRVKQQIKNGDAVTIYGRYQGASNYRSYGNEIEVFDWAPTSDAENVQRIAGIFEKHRPVEKKEVAPAPKTEKSVEDRLQELENLKAKGLITPDEYQEQHRRILNDL